jgi:hypothetical protein
MDGSEDAAVDSDELLSQHLRAKVHHLFAQLLFFRDRSFFARFRHEFHDRLIDRLGDGIVGDSARMRVGETLQILVMNLPIEHDQAPSAANDHLPVGPTEIRLLIRSDPRELESAKLRQCVPAYRGIRAVRISQDERAPGSASTPNRVHQAGDDNEGGHGDDGGTLAPSPSARVGDRTQATNS